MMDSDVQDGPVNLGNPVELTVSDLGERVLALTGSASRVVNLPLPQDDPRRRRPEIRRAQALLGWEPKVPLQQGLEATVAWFAGERKASESVAGRRPGPSQLVEVAAE